MEQKPSLQARSDRRYRSIPVTVSRSEPRLLSSFYARYVPRRAARVCSVPRSPRSGKTFFPREKSILRSSSAPSPRSANQPLADLRSRIGDNKRPR